MEVATLSRAQTARDGEPERVLTAEPVDAVESTENETIVTVTDNEDVAQKDIVPHDGDETFSATPLLPPRSECDDLRALEGTLVGFEDSSVNPKQQQINGADVIQVLESEDQNNNGAETIKKSEDENESALETDEQNKVDVIDAENNGAVVASEMGYGDEFEVIPVVSRTLLSPIPGDEQLQPQHLQFTGNVDYLVEDMISDTRGGVEEHGVMGWTGVLGDDSFDGFIETEDNIDSESSRGQVKTPMLRPSTPTAVVAVDLEKDENRNGELASSDAPVPDVGATTSLNAAELVAEGIDREDVIARIKAELDIKDRYKLKNTLLQNRLGEYFRRKRVGFRISFL